MSPQKFERKLSAILSADAVEYSRLMGEDEDLTIQTLTGNREMMATLIKQYKGRVVDSPGDNLLAEFSSVTQAVNCAVEIQRELAERNAELPEDRRMEYRIGVNLGDVAQEGDRIYGDGVNIAARLESLAEPGGICISGFVYNQVKNRLKLEYEYLGEQSVKNIKEAVPVYRVLSFPGAAAHRVIEAKKAAEKEIMASSFQDKPSIAVLPFVNMSGDPEQEYFSDGIADEIITGLSQHRDLFVIARNSSFTFKGSAVDIKSVGRELGVRYVLEGGVRKAGQRLRVLAQLIDTTTGNHIWAERYDGTLEDMFDLQDEITARVVGTIQQTVFLAEIERVRRKHPENLSAYEMCMRGWAHEVELDQQNLVQARQCFLKAIELDNRLPRAYTGLAGVSLWEYVFGWSANPRQSMADAKRAAQRAVTIDEGDAEAHTWLSVCFSIFDGRLDLALAEAERAVELSPNNAMARNFRSVAYCFDGRPEEGIMEAKMALRLSPRDWCRVNFLHNLALSQYTARDYSAAAETATKVVALKPDYPYGHWHLACSCAQLGQMDRARAALGELLRLLPGLDSEFVVSVASYRNSADLEHVIDGLRKAGWEG
jgi:adenylate cyclase